MALAGIILITLVLIARVALLFVKGSGPVVTVIKAIGDTIKAHGKQQL